MSKPVSLPRRLEDQKKNRTRTATWAGADDADLDRDGTATVHTPGERSERYAVTRFPCDLSGRAYRVVKCVLGGDAYDVLIADRPADDICDCRGHTRYGYCKHVDALRALIADGRLPDEQAHPGDDHDFREDFAARFETTYCV